MPRVVSLSGQHLAAAIDGYSNPTYVLRMYVPFSQRKKLSRLHSALILLLLDLGL